MTRIAATLLSALFPLFALADYTNTGIQVECVRPKNELRFHAETLMSERALSAAAPEAVRDQFIREAKARNLYLEGEFDYRCKLERAELRIWGEIFKPSESGECGADPGGKVYLSINGIPILHFLNLGNSCFPSVWQAKITVPRSGSSSGQRAQLVLCGFDRFGATSGEEPKCVTRTVPITRPANPEQRPVFLQDDLERLVQ